VRLEGQTHLIGRAFERRDWCRFSATARPKHLLDGMTPLRPLRSIGIVLEPGVEGASDP
jgi:hypothetical protein